jgi:peptidoglycan/xylan/chitin deacetylase (PgdA/CDA1 family)
MKRFWFPVLRLLFSQCTWKVKTHKKNIYLTFDDGPEPGVTPQVLSLLHNYNAKATFFCLGTKVEQYPDLWEMIKKKGHVVANHGYSHLDGFKTSTNTYIENFLKGAEITGSNLFRPPYGRITPWQYYKIKKSTKIIMWSAMSMDFSKKITIKKCVNRVLKNSYPGAIIVFHDSVKASDTVLNALPKILEVLSAKGFSFETLC